jgi:hypothetical protein
LLLSSGQVRQRAVGEAIDADVLERLVRAPRSSCVGRRPRPMRSYRPIMTTSSTLSGKL